MINDPICRFDCDIPVDGVAAFVFTSAERARDLPHRPVYVAGLRQRRPGAARLPLHWPLDDIMEVGTETARRLWERSGVGPGEVDLPQVYDGFSPFVYFWMEALGLCPRRGGTPTAPDRRDRQRRGRRAARALGRRRARATAGCTACPQMLECYLQLSGRAGERQRAKRVDRRRLPLVSPLRRRRGLQRGAVLIRRATDGGRRSLRPSDRARLGFRR